MNKKWFLLLLTAMQAETMIQARGGGGGHGGGHGGGRGGHSRGGGSHSGHSGYGGHGGHGRHGGYGHGGYGGWGWGGFGVGIASGMLIGLAVSAPAYYNNPSTAAQQETVDRIKDLQQQVYSLQHKIDTADNMKDIKNYQTQIKEKSKEAQRLIDTTPDSDSNTANSY
ncbi:hypothetical protein KBB68_00300 [Candidatus Babeliales bacterium]|nr:hypothetical protein [Candidatus Babeliales bacterium]